MGSLIHISLNINKGGPYIFCKNLIEYISKLKNIKFTNNIKNCDLAILIGENYKINDLLFLIISRKIYFLD